MRPVDRGPPPADLKGLPKVFPEFQAAREDLFERLGRYCSYCERPIKVALAVEHVLPKSIHPNLELEWSNLLVACANCNATKASRPMTRAHCYFPDMDNTFRALAYSEGGIVKPGQELTPRQARGAKRLLKLVGLDRLPGNSPKVNDLRWNDRREAWDLATRSLAMYKVGLRPTGTIVELCRCNGHWSIWMTVFQEYVDVRLALLKDWQGTATHCFDARTNPVQRTGGCI